MNDPNEIRARIVHADGTVEEASDDRALCEAINRLIKGQ